MRVPSLSLAMMVALASAACAPQSTPADPPTGPSPPAALAGDRAQPVLALFEHVLAPYFAAAGSAVPTTCASLRPTALTAQQEEALVLRFPRLAPAARCRPAGAGHVDSITGKPAAVVQVYEFACRDAANCTGWAMLPGMPATQYTMTFAGSAWQFAGDRRLLAQ